MSINGGKRNEKTFRYLYDSCILLTTVRAPCGPSGRYKSRRKTGTKGARISENLFSGYTDGIYKDKYYEIDTYQPKEEDKNVFQKVGGYLFGDDSVGKDLQRMLYTTCQWLANMAFQLNVILGQLTIFLVDQALNLDIVDTVADKLGAAMQNIAGIGKGGFYLLDYSQQLSVLRVCYRLVMRVISSLLNVSPQKV